MQGRLGNHEGAILWPHRGDDIIHRPLRQFWPATNYGAAKASLIGFMNSLKLEGAKDNIKVNAICPVAATRMTEIFCRPQSKKCSSQNMFRPRWPIWPAKRRLADSTSTAAAGVFAAARMEETDGINLGHTATAEDVAAHFAQIADWSSAKPYGQGGEQSAKFLARIQISLSPAEIFFALQKDACVKQWLARDFAYGRPRAECQACAA